MKPQLAIRYFQSFANKDIASLDLLMADNVVLTDWEVQIMGKENILAHNKRFFDRVKTLNVDIQKIAIGQDCVISEIRIIVNNSGQLFVTDVIEFDDEDKIKAIRAYKR